MSRNVQKHIEAYNRKFAGSNKQYAEFTAGEWFALIESGKVNGTVDPLELSANAMYFGFMVGYKAAMHEMKGRVANAK